MNRVVWEPSQSGSRVTKRTEDLCGGHSASFQHYCPGAKWDTPMHKTSNQEGGRRLISNPSVQLHERQYDREMAPQGLVNGKD